ncbi:MAG: carbohydrate ABC transporter permease [Acidimicrobiaceae bacterium]|nr:carbohydrate ABC transporter permease [Acidimicrobiaceae bacterium]
MRSLLTRSAPEMRGAATASRRIARRVPLHVTLGVLCVWSVLPFLWTVQTSVKFTRDVLAREPVLWGYETTANAYRAFWLGDDDINMWGVFAYIAAAGLIAAVLALVGKRMRRSWPWYCGAGAVLLVAMWRFPKIWETNDEYDFLVNSIVVTILTMLISLSIGLVAGYGLARYSGISGAVILIVALGFRALPRSAFVLPYFFGATWIDDWLESSGVGTFDFPLIDFPFIDQLQLLDTRLVLVLALVAVNQPFTIWMFRSFFLDVPKELEEAAMMDGATRLQAFRKVIIPVMWPAIIATGLFTMLLAYNEFLFVRVLAPTEWTLPVAIVSLTGGESSRTITEAAAAAVSITLPIVIVIILFQKHLVKGLGAGAVKG